jgi:DNA (cytosine-5)-methyltransferase 1
MPERMRYFCMGNALVVPLVTKMGNEILTLINGET